MPRAVSKSIEIVAGPNGSGKTSFANSYFRARNLDIPFINADIIATGLAPGHEQLAAFRAGRVVISAVKEAIENGDSVAFESTLSGKTWLPLIRNAKAEGYAITIYFLYLKKVQLNIQRIERRVRLGGHSVPISAVKRRYPRSFQNFWHLFRPLSNEWYVFDNSLSKPRRVMWSLEWESLEQDRKMKFEQEFLER